MTRHEKERLCDEIFIKQKNLLSIVLIHSQRGVSYENLEILISLLLVLYCATRMVHPDLPEISEDEIESCMNRLFEEMKFTENMSQPYVKQGVQQYIDRHPNKLMLAFAYREMNRAGFINATPDGTEMLVFTAVVIATCLAEKAEK